MFFNNSTSNIFQFSSLATEVRSALNQPQHPISYLTIDKLEHGLKDRALMTADIGAQIIAVTTRLSQKDVLLSSYQEDLSHLRFQVTTFINHVYIIHVFFYHVYSFTDSQTTINFTPEFCVTSLTICKIVTNHQLKMFIVRKSELDADDAGVEAKVLQKKVTSLQEESSQLRKSLTHLQGELDQQQRLNHALAQRNVRLSDKLYSFTPLFSLWYILYCYFIAIVWCFDSTNR